MGWNDVYWTGRNERKTQAAKHHELMLKRRANEIKNSVENTLRYRFKVDNIVDYVGVPEAVVVNMDTVSAIYEYGTGDSGTVALNFASYKNPGGGFLNGSSAQEESLCMESTLYEVLSDPRLADYYFWNNQHKNRSLYLNLGLLSPGIVFERDKKETIASVLTVAAPNRKAYIEYISEASEDENLQALEDRIGFVIDILNSYGTEVAILGAYGCGVFGQDPETVATLFRDKLVGSPIKKVVYAVIDKGGHSKEGAYATFKRVIER